LGPALTGAMLQKREKMDKDDLIEELRVLNRALIEGNTELHKRLNERLVAEAEPLKLIEELIKEMRQLRAVLWEHAKAVRQMPHSVKVRY
jgi:hypothetical protein